MVKKWKPKIVEPIHKGKCPNCKRGKLVPDAGMEGRDTRKGYRVFVCWTCNYRQYQKLLGAENR